MATGRAVMFLLLPVFTRLLTPAEYGSLSVALAVNGVAVILFAFGMDIMIFRHIVRLEDDAVGQQRFVASIWSFLLTMPLLVATVAAAIGFATLGDSDLVTPVEFALAVLSAALFVGATTVPLSLLRASNRLRDFVVLNAISMVSIPVLTVVALAVFQAGPTGWLLAQTVGVLAMLIGAVFIVPFERPAPFDVQAVKSLLRSSLPVLPHFLAMWSLQLADRLLLASIVSTSLLGVYSLAANAALPVFVILVGVNQALMIEYARLGKRGEDAETSIRTRGLVRYQVGFVALVALACALLAPVAVHLFLPDDFHAAAGLTPWLVLGYAFLGLEAITMNGITLTHGHTAWIWVGSAAAAAVNLLGVWIFAPRYGIEAAAIASAAGYLALLVVVETYATIAEARLNYPWVDMGLIVTTSVAVYALGVMTVSDLDLVDLLLRSAWVGLFLAVVYMLVFRKARQGARFR